MTVETIADELYRELEEPDDVSIPSIAFWLVSNIGRLNNLIGTDFTIESSVIVPDLHENQKAIYKTLYFIHYYKRQVNSNLGAAGYSAIAEVKEGNRTVRRTNKTEIAKNYRSMVADYNDELMQQLMAYKMNQCTPEQFIVGNPILTDCIDAYPYNPRDHVLTD